MIIIHDTDSKAVKRDSIFLPDIILTPIRSRTSPCLKRLTVSFYLAIHKKKYIVKLIYTLEYFFLFLFYFYDAYLSKFCSSFHD
jgi:hypothetical protein